MTSHLLIPLSLLAALSVAADAQMPTTQTAVFAGGCYWGTESVFDHVKGVINVVSGYAGGSASNANYRAVSEETTRHAESVQISYDPSQITYYDLLLIFFATHDPTQVNRQGPDQGASYRSAIFPQSAEQASAAQAFINKVNAVHVYKRPVATRIEYGTFYPAEREMQHYAERHPSEPYIVDNDKPKLKLLQQKFPNYYKD